MAEYINKQKYREEWLKFKTFEPMKCLDSIPIADVIERAKIDNAIKEMNSMPLGLVMDCDEMRDYCVEILKRNIGE